MFLRESKLPVDLLVPPPREPTVHDGDQHMYVKRLEKCMRLAYNTVNEMAAKAQEKQKAAYDQKVHVQVLKAGDQVLVTNKTPRGRF